MNLQSLTYFLAVRDRGSIQGAAERLHLTPQALSEHVKRMEAELNAPLLKKTRPVTLTEAGQCFAACAEEMLERYHAMERQLRELGTGRRQLVVSTPPQGTPPFLAGVIRAFTAQRPDCMLSIQQRGEHPGALELRQYDLNLSMDPLGTELEQVTFQLEDAETETAQSLYIARPELLKSVWGESYAERCGLALAGQLEVLRDVPFIRLRQEDGQVEWELAHSRAGFLPTAVVSVDSTELCFSLCSAGVGGSVVPKSWLEDRMAHTAQELGLFCCPLPGTPAVARMIVSYEKGKTLSPEEQLFISLMMRELRR